MAYRTSSEMTWTRIEMLVALYGETIATLKLVAETEPNSSERFQHRLKALSLISAIESGVDTSYGEIPNNVLKLCEFVRTSILDVDSEKLPAAITVMQNLHDGFAAIQPQAVDLERKGVTTRLEMVSTLQVDV